MSSARSVSATTSLPNAATAAFDGTGRSTDAVSSAVLVVRSGSGWEFNMRGRDPGTNTTRTGLACRKLTWIQPEPRGHAPDSASHLDLGAQLHHPIRRQIEEGSRRTRVPRQEREQYLSPAREFCGAGRQQRLATQVIRGHHRLRGHTARRSGSENLRYIG